MALFGLKSSPTALRTRSHSIQPCLVSPKRGACFAATSRLPVRLICPKEILRRIPPRTLCFSRRRGAVASLEPWQRRLRARPSSAFLQDSDNTHMPRDLSFLNRTDFFRKSRSSRRVGSRNVGPLHLGPRKQLLPAHRHRKSDRESATKDR